MSSDPPKLRIAISSSGLGHVYRGAEIWANNLAYALHERGLDVTLFKGGGKPESDIEEVIPCIKRNSIILGGKESKLPWLWRIRIEGVTFSLVLLMKLILSEKYDIIHIDTEYLSKKVMLAKRLGLLHSKIVCINNGGASEALYRSGMNIQQVAQHYEDEAKEKGINTKNWFVIPHFVDAKKFMHRSNINMREKLKIPKNAFVVLSVGAVSRRYKRMDWIIKEFSKFHKEVEKNSYLVVVGELEEDSKELIKWGKFLLKDNIRFLSNIPNNEMPSIYSMADVFTLGTLTEVFGIVFLEAMASEVPVIAHNYPVTKWIVGDGGECIDMTQEGRLSSTLKKYTNDDFRKEKGGKARERAKKLFSKEKMIKDILRMYNQILNRKTT